MNKFCIVIPVYEHAAPLESVLENFRPTGMTCIVVDDGSGPVCQARLEAMAKSQAGVTLSRLNRNQGKGAAVKMGLHLAEKMGFTHAMQVDADAQHDLSVVPKLLAVSETEPESVICGQPVFDADVPGVRLYGRRLTNFWVRVNTLSSALPDAMCGFRIYPLARVNRLIENEKTGNRMDFDPEILVRLYWAGLRMKFLPVAVHYPENGTSHFRMGLDNWLISRMHARLFLGMLFRILPLLRRERMS